MTTMKVMPVAGALVGLWFVAGAWSGDKGPHPIWLAGDLIGMKVLSEQGENLGKIEDLVVRPNGDASYAVLSFGGWLSMGDKLFAMPWSVLWTVEPDTAKKDSERSLVLPLVKERLEAAPSFDEKSWPKLANPDWTKDIDAFYVGDVNPDTKRPIDAAARTAAITWRATELKGTHVTTPAGDKLGEIGELAIDTSGRVSYVTLSVGEFLGVGDRLVPVPWDLLKFSLGGDKGDMKLITLATTKDQLERAPRFKKGKENCAEMCDPKWIAGVYDHFSCAVYWKDGEESGVRGSKD